MGIYIFREWIWEYSIYEQKLLINPSIPLYMKIYVIDNGGQWTHREWRVLRDLGADTKIVPNTTPFEEISDADGIVLSGGTPRIGLNSEKMGKNGEYLERAQVPIMGICAGHQFMALFFGGKAAPSRVPEFGKTTIFVDREDELLDGVESPFQAWESHNDEVTELPPGFVALAHSDSCMIQIMRHEERPLFGIQFHPEVEHTQFGERIFENFLKICGK